MNMRKSYKVKEIIETAEKEDYGFLKILPQLRENKVTVKPNLQLKKQLKEEFKQILGL
ncbi:hypothetical protein [Dehalobacter sp. TBBPA1]|uniref:hypothetical protein n=1 Tax=Dehalobacter sp. TBBPA1 TaxID=3235037 RepID=UPI0034A35F00